MLEFIINIAKVCYIVRGLQNQVEKVDGSLERASHSPKRIIDVL